MTVKDDEMKIDLHSHLKLTKSAQFMPDYFEDMVRQAKKAGLDAIAMTEHFNTLNFPDVYDYIMKTHEYKDGYYEISGIKVFPGLEVDVQEVGHILIIGDVHDVLSIREGLNGYEEKGSFIEFASLMDLADNYNVLRIGAHPFRDSTPLTNIDPEELKRLDAFDLNGQDLFNKGVEQTKAELEPFAAELGLPITGGSDTHQYMQYGAVYNVLAKDVNNVTELKEVIQARNYQVKVAEDLRTRVKAAKTIKKLLKGSLDQNGESPIYSLIANASF